MIKNLFKTKKVIFLFATIVLVSFFGKTAFGVWSGTFYEPGDTLNPECLPTQTDCDVRAPLTSSNISDTAYDATTWDGVTTIAPSKNAVRDKIESLAGGHDAVTIWTANGLSLATQALSLALASTSTTGALSSTDWNTFNNKAPALGADDNYVTDAQLVVIGDTSGANTGDNSANSSSQPVDSDLTTIAGLTATTNNFIQSSGSAWASRTPTEVTATLDIFGADAGAGGVKGLVPATIAGDATKFLRGDATWAEVATGTPTAITVADETTDTSSYLAFFTAATGDLGPKTNSNLTFNSNTGVATFGQTISGSISGNAGTVTNGVYTTDAGTVFLAPNGSAASLTSFPTLNQNTTGTAAGLTAQYIDWSSSSGGNSIANKPTLGTISSQAASSVAITGVTIAGLTGLAIRDTSAAFDVTIAGTSSTALTVGRTLTIDMVDAAATLKLGSNFLGNGTATVTGANTGDNSANSSSQPVDSDLTTIAGLTATTNNFIQSSGSAWASRTPTEVTATLDIFGADAGAGGVKGLVPATIAGDATKFLRGDATWAEVATGTPTAITVADETTDTSSYLAFFTAATGDLGPKTNSNLTFNSNTGVATFGQTISGSISGNAGTVTNGVYTTDAGTVFLAPNGSAASLTSFPTLNQNTT